MNSEESLEIASLKYCFTSFRWPNNKEGEPISIPPGQTVPNGFTKHKRLVKKAFIEGALWQNKRSYSLEELINAFSEGHKSAREKGSYRCNGTYQEDLDKFLEQFKK